MTFSLSHDLSFFDIVGFNSDEKHFFSEVRNFKAAAGHAKRKQKRPNIIVKQRKNAFKTAFDL